jgi:hypothetical protein
MPVTSSAAASAATGVASRSSRSGPIRSTTKPSAIRPAASPAQNIAAAAAPSAGVAPRAARTVAAHWPAPASKPV